MERIAIIDLGSNTARLLIMEISATGHFHIVDQLKEAPRLGEGMDRDGFLKPQRIQETIKTIKMFRKLCDSYGIEKITAVATAAVRHAKNQRSFLDEVASVCGIKFKVLSAEEEAMYVYKGVINTMDIPKGLILEIADDADSAFALEFPQHPVEFRPELGIGDVMNPSDDVPVAGRYCHPSPLRAEVRMIVCSVK